MQNQSAFIPQGDINAYSNANLVGAKAGKAAAKLPEIYKLCRSYSQGGGFVASVLWMWRVLLLDGLRIEFQGKTDEWQRTQGNALKDLVDNIALELLTCESAAVIWVENTSGVAHWQVPDSENLTYCVLFGDQSLKVKLPKVSDMTGVVDRYKNAMKDGVAWGDANNEGWRIAMFGKRNLLQSPPRLYSVFEEIAALNLLRIGDFNGAWAAKDLVRHYSKGHEIKTGDKAGDPRHFLKTTQAKKIKAELLKKQGYWDLIANFDVALKYYFLDAAFFDEKKYAGLMARMVQWAGPISGLMKGEVDRLPALRAEGAYLRSKIAGLAEEVLNATGFLQGAAKATGVRVTFNTRTFETPKGLLELVRLSHGNGLASPQTAREEIGYDDERESERMMTAHSKAKAYTPPFEAKQGMATGSGETGGRPVETL